jgi:hypothetical protein
MIKYLTQCVTDRRPFVFARLGDGELACMRGDAGTNCDGVAYSPQLAEDLKAAYAYFGDHGAFIERFEPDVLHRNFAHVWRPIDLLIEYQKWEDYWGWSPWVKCNVHHARDLPLEPVVAFWKQVQRTPRPKVLVSGARVEGLQNDLWCSMWFVTYPDKAYEQVEAAAQTIIDVCGETGVAVLCCGLAAKVIMHKVMLARPRVTLIDAGSSFDALYGCKSRTNALKNTKFADLYD